MRRRALVIGGSLGGLFAAHLLRRGGWDAIVFERNDGDLTGRGVGLGTHPQLIAVLRRAGIAFDETMGIRLAKVVCLDRAGKVIVDQPTARTMSSWSRLYRALRSTLPAEHYKLGKKLCRIEQDDEGVTATFEDGSRERGDLLVGVDGIRSAVRQQFLPQAQPLYAGYVAWRAVLDEAQVPPRAHRDIFELYTFCLPEGEQLLGYPVPGHDGDTVPGRRRYNIVWYRPLDPLALDNLCTDASGQLYAGGIAPSLIRKEVIAAVKADAAALLAPQLAEIFVRSEPFFQPIFDLESPTLVFGRVALTGDAAFVVRPMSAPERPRQQLMQRFWPTALAALAKTSQLGSRVSKPRSCRSATTSLRSRASRVLTFRRGSSRSRSVGSTKRGPTLRRSSAPTAPAATRSATLSRHAGLPPIFSFS